MSETDQDFLMRRNLPDAGLPEGAITGILSPPGEGRGIAGRRIPAATEQAVDKWLKSLRSAQ